MGVLGVGQPSVKDCVVLAANVAIGEAKMIQSRCKHIVGVLYIR